MAGFRRFKNRFLPFLPSGYQIRQTRNRLLRKLGLTRAYEPAILTEDPALRFGSVLPLVIAKHVLAHGELTFLQIGAYDGSVGDEVLNLIERYPVRGVLVEPQPTAFARLQQLHQHRDNLLFVNSAIDCVRGTRNFYVAKEGDVEFASFDRNHLLRHGLADHEIVSKEIDCLTIDDVLRQSNIDSVDFLQIDAEGYDYEILKSIDFTRIRPHILRFEYRHFSQHDIDECLKMLATHGYRFLTEQLDLIGIRCEKSQLSANDGVMTGSVSSSAA